MGFDTDAGTLVVTDLMPVALEQDKSSLMLPDHQILRVAECVQGEVELEMRFVPRPGYGRRPGRIRNAGPLGVRVEMGADVLVLRTNLTVDVSADGEIRGRARGRGGSGIVDVCRRLASRPVPTWRLVTRSDRPLCTLVASLGLAATVRGSLPQHSGSALALKLLVYAPSGAVVAAPTTSLPERLGGDLNWDYRFCWLRDAALTVRALAALSCMPEAHAFVSWLLHTTRLTQPELRILYDVYGNEPPAERVVKELAGYRGSRPVRVGNAATEQQRLDVYGEVIDAVTHFVRAGGTLDRDTERMLCAFGEYVCRHWQEPDEGIWEPRSGQAHNTDSRVLCWTALDRLLQLHADGHVRRASDTKFQENRERIRREVEARGWNPAISSYVSQLDGKELDATLLLLPWYGFEDAGSHRMRATYRRVRERLGAGDALLYRYRTGESAGEGAFGICSFWGAEYVALGGGTIEEARDLFERVCAHANDVGLFAEEIDPATGAALGNFPQAFTHVGLINAAVTLVRRLEGAPPIERRLPQPKPDAETQKVSV